MGSLQRSLVVYRLHLRVMRANLVAYVVLGVLLPLGTFRLMMAAQPRELVLRLLLGNVVFSAVLLGPRQSTNLVRLAVFGQQRLLSGFGVGHLTALSANALYIISMIPYCIAVCGIAVLAHDVQPPVSGLFLVPLVPLAGFLAGVAYVISGTSSSPAAALAKTNLFVLGSVAFTPMFYPLANVPTALRALASVLPQTLCTDAMTAAWSGHSSLARPVLLLSAWAAALGLAGFWAEARKEARAQL